MSTTIRNKRLFSLLSIYSKTKEHLDAENSYKLYENLSSDGKTHLKNLLKLKQTYEQIGDKTVAQALIDTYRDNIIVTSTNPYGNNTDQYIE